ncbi:FAD:protein FMN transferase [Variovorax sp. VNK109]|uniref:FAD:protein FMN transferase n=1 Tax=Variovorax sp. VNK109 TaxID=3400919 RepID=UPI003C0C371E
MRPNFGSWLTQGYANTASPRKADPSTLHEVSGRTMGTTWSVRFANASMLPLDDVRAAAQAALDEVVGQMSHWEPDSDITRFNRSPAGTWHALPAEFFRVLQCALLWADRSGGACDPTVGALVNLWGFGPRADGANAVTPPSRQAINDVLASSGWHRLELDTQAQRVLQPGGIVLDFSGIAKGFAVDHVASALRALQIESCLVEVGGELFGKGHRPDGLAWRVSVSQPGEPHRRMYTVALDGLAIATSGDAWHFFEHEGQRYSHTIDPRSGQPVAASLASVTVLHADCMNADALATALTVMGPDAGLTFAEELNLAALFIERAAGGELSPRMSAAFAGHIQQQ